MSEWQKHLDLMVTIDETSRKAKKEYDEKRIQEESRRQREKDRREWGFGYDF